MVTSTQKYAFILGREHEICLEELKAVLSRFDFCFNLRISGNIVFANIESISSEDIFNIMNALSGTIKIFRLSQISNFKSQNLRGLCEAALLEKAQNSKHKVNFGISDYSGKYSVKQVNDLGLSVKKSLKNKLKLRFVALKDSSELSSIVSLKNNLTTPTFSPLPPHLASPRAGEERLSRGSVEGVEFGIFNEGIGTLIALNDPEEWNKRDYGKPASDKYSGMMPPKLARMMVNIALASSETGDRRPKVASFKISRTTTYELRSTVIDPFCGSGNILLEAMMLGCDVIGSDISEKAVNDTKTNLGWLLSQPEARRSKTGRTTNYEPRTTVFQADATSKSYIEKLSALSLKPFTNKSIAFVTEPYLGSPKKFKPTYNAVRGEYESVKKLYLQFMKNIVSLFHCFTAANNETMKPCNNDKVLCIVFPLIETFDRGRFSLYAECVDEIKKMGYTQVRTPMVYGREYQVVKRELVLLKLT